MTSLYVVPQQTGRQYKQSKRRDKKGKAKNNNAFSLLPEGEDDDAFLTKSPLSKLANKFLCFNNINSDDDNGGDDSIEVHFLDRFLDTDSPIMPALCKSSGLTSSYFCTVKIGDTCSSGTRDRDRDRGGLLLNTSHDGGSFTDDTAVNTSNDDSIRSYTEDNRGSTPFARWMSSAITNVWDNVVSSNMQCCNGGTSWAAADALSSSEPTYSKDSQAQSTTVSGRTTTKGTKDRHIKNNKFKSSSTKNMKRESCFQVNSLDITPSSFTYDDSTTSKVRKNSISSALSVPFEIMDDSHYEDSNDSSEVEPLVGRQLFDNTGKRRKERGTKDSFGDDSESTAMTCNYSNSMALPYNGGERNEGCEGGDDDDGSCYSEEFHYLPEEEEEDGRDVST